MNGLIRLFGQLLSEGDTGGRRCTALHPHTNPVQIVRFTYQRFADYRVIAALLKPLNGDPARLRDALRAGKPLRKRVLEAPPSWIEALAVQLPEQFGIELWDAARWRLQPFIRHQWDQAFVQSLATRRHFRRHAPVARVALAGAAPVGESARSCHRDATDDRPSPATPTECGHVTRSPQELVDALSATLCGVFRRISHWTTAVRWTVSYAGRPEGRILTIPTR